MNKKLLILFFGIFLLIFMPLMSAEKITYHPNDLDIQDMKVNVSDTIFFGLIGIDNLGSAELKSHKHTKEVIKVGLGNQVTMYYDFNFKELYENGLGEVIFINMRTEKEVERNYKYVYWTKENYEEDIYECSDVTSSNGTVNNVCSVVGTETKTRNVWKDYDTKNIPKGKIRIGIEVESFNGDYIDGIWTIATKKVDKHASWNATLETGALVWFDFEETSGTNVINKAGGQNGTIIGSLTQLGDSYNFSGGGWINMTGLTSSAGTYTVAYWLNPHNLTGADDTQIGFDSQSGRLFTYLAQTDGDLGYFDGAVRDFSSIQMSTTAMKHYVFTFNSTGGMLFIDGVKTGSTLAYTSRNLGGITSVGSNNVGTNRYTGIMSQFVLYNRSLTGSEIISLYNDGEKLTWKFAPDTPPKVTLNSPANDTSFAVPSVTFNVTVTDDVQVQNVSLYIDGVLDQTNTSQYNGTYIFTKSLTNGNHNWSILAYDNESQSNQSETRTLTVTVVPPTITLSVPVDNYKSNTASNTFYAYVTDNLGVENVSLYLNGVLDQTNTDGLNATNYTFTKTLTEGSHTWYIEAYDNDSFSSTSATRTIVVDLTNPVSRITSPSGSFGSLFNGANMTLNFTANDTNLDSCIWEYNGVNYTSPCSTGIVNTAYFDYVLDVNTGTLYVNDTSGRTNYSTTNWDYRFNENHQTFQASVLEGSITNIQANLSLGSGYDVTYANLVYNGTSTLGTITEEEGFTILSYNKTLIQVDADLNTSFYWTVYFTDDFSANLTTQNQTIINLGIDDCSSYTNLLLNLTILDEDSQRNFTLVNGENSTIEVYLKLQTLSETEIANLTEKYSDENPALVCISSVLGDEQYYLDATIKYEGGLHSIEYYNLQNFLIENSSLPEVIKLYSLNLSRATEFQVSYRNDAGIPQENVLIQVSREYVSEGVFKVVEQPQTDSNGQTVVHLVQNDIRYNFVVSKDGTLLAVLTNKVAFCEDATIGKCEVNLKEDSSALEFYNYDQVFGISYTATYNDTSRDINFDFVTNDGTVKNVTIIITKFDMLGSSPVAQKSLTSTSGKLTYKIPESIGNATYIIDTYVNGEIIEEFTLSTHENVPLGKYGFVLFFFMFLSLIFMFSSSKSGLVIGSILGFVTAGLLGLQGKGTEGVLASVIWLIIAGGILLWKLNQKGGSN